MGNTSSRPSPEGEDHQCTSPAFRKYLIILRISEYGKWLDKVDVVEIMSGFVRKHRPSPLGEG
jgi:hypothetical protein